MSENNKKHHLVTIKTTQGLTHTFEEVLDWYYDAPSCFDQFTPRAGYLFDPEAMLTFPSGCRIRRKDIASIQLKTTDIPDEDDSTETTEDAPQ